MPDPAATDQTPEDLNLKALGSPITTPDGAVGLITHGPSMINPLVNFPIPTPPEPGQP